MYQNVKISIMAAPNEVSNFCFFGRISDELARYLVQGVGIGNNIVLGVCRDNVALSLTTTLPPAEVLTLMNSAIENLQSSFTLVTDKPITIRLQSLAENKGGTTRTIAAWPLDSKSLPTLPENDPINYGWRQAALISRELYSGHSNYRLSLKDYRQALSDRSDDAFLYAYRAVENICRIVAGSEELNNATWKKLRGVLNIREEDIYPLRNVSFKVRHGNFSHLIVNEARKKRR